MARHPGLNAASRAQRIANARRVGEYFYQTVVPALEEAFEELKAKGKAPAYMSCGQAFERYNNSIYDNNYMFAPNFYTPDDTERKNGRRFLEHMCILHSRGLTQELTAHLQDAVKKVAAIEAPRAAKSKADWEAFNTYIRPLVKDAFEHARDNGYITRPVKNFKEYWARLCASASMSPTPIDKKGLPADFKFQGMIDALSSTDPLAVHKQIYEAMNKQNEGLSRHITHNSERFKELKQAADAIAHFRTEEGRAEHEQDLQTLRDAATKIESLQNPGFFTKLRESFDTQGAIARLTAQTLDIYKRVTLDSRYQKPGTEDILNAVKHISAYTSLENTILSRVAVTYCYAKDKTQDYRVTIDDILEVGKQDHTVGTFPALDDYLKECPKRSMPAMQDKITLTAPKFQR